MGRRVLRRHIWGYSVCLCPIKGTPGLNELIAFHEIQQDSQLSMRQSILSVRHMNTGPGNSAYFHFCQSKLLKAQQNGVYQLVNLQPLFPLVCYEKSKLSYVSGTVGHKLPMAGTCSACAMSYT